MKSNNPFTRITALVALALGSADPARAADAPTGIIVGHVTNPATGTVVERARIAVVGTALETFSDVDGHYRLPGVPAGSAELRASFTGFPAAVARVNVTAGQTATHDFELSPQGARSAGAAGGLVKLDEFVVATSREMSGAALAINEQRFAPNLKTVVAADEFGDVAEGNVAEFLKFLPGVTVDVTGGHARGVSINGAPADYVPVTIDGFSPASAVGSGGVGGTGRLVAMDMVSLNNLSRLEVSFSPTPDSEGGALAGSINLVPRSSFERARPAFNSSVFVMLRDNARDLHKTPGPHKPTRKVHPGFNFSYVAPVNKRFGYAISGSFSRQSTSAPLSQNTWRGVNVATNGVAFPHTSFDQPYLSTYGVRTGANQHTRGAFGASVDYKLTPHDRITLAFQSSTLDVEIYHNQLTFNVNRVLPGQFTTRSTQGAAGAGDVQLSTSSNVRRDWTYMPSLLWRHDSPGWKAEAGGALARARHRKDEPADATFGATTARRTGLTVGFADIFYLRPGVITVTDGATGLPVNPYSLDNYVVTSAVAGRNASDDTRRTAYANVRRDFFLRVPFTLKAGLDVRQIIRDNGGDSATYSYVGADGRPSTTPAGSDDRAMPFIDPSFSSRDAGFGFPRLESLSSSKLYSHAVANPNQFVVDNNGLYRNAVNLSKRAQETVSSAYVRGDLALFNNRLKLVGGLRAEQTNIDAEGPLSDPSRNFQRDARGVPIRGANGVPLPITTDALQASRLTFLPRAAKAEKEYLRLFPSLNANYSLRENLVVRAAVYNSVGRPNFNQYSGGITLPDLDSPATPTNRITVNNVGIKAWSARTVNLRLEYYFAGVGQFSVGAFRRDFENFFGSVVFNPTADFLALYGLDPSLYGGYEVATQFNLPQGVRMEGADVNYKQALTFLPHWARGLQVFANASIQKADGVAVANFAGYTPHSGSWGFSLTRERYSLRANWNYRGRRQLTEVAAGPSIEPGTYNWIPRWMSLDVSAEYQLRKRLAVFANLREVNKPTTDTEIGGPSTPAHALLRQRLDFASLWTIGFKTTF